MLRRIAFPFGCAMAIAASPLVAQEQKVPNEAPVAATAADKREALDQFDPAMVFELGLRASEVSETLDTILEGVLSKGAPVDGWFTGGISYHEAMLEFEAENGSAFYVETDAEMPFVSYREGTVDLLGDDWEKHRIFEGHAEGTIEFGLARIAPGIWLEFATGTKRIHNAQCNAGIAQIDLVAAKSLSEWSNEDLGLAILLYGMFKRIADTDLCTVFYRNDDGGLTSMAFDSEGRPFTEINKAPDIGHILTRAEALAAIASIR